MLHLHDNEATHRVPSGQRIQECVVARAGNVKGGYTCLLKEDMHVLCIRVYYVHQLICIILLSNFVLSNVTKFECFNQPICLSAVMFHKNIAPTKLRT